MHSVERVVRNLHLCHALVVQTDAKRVWGGCKGPVAPQEFIQNLGVVPHFKTIAATLTMI